MTNPDNTPRIVNLAPASSIRTATAKWLIDNWVPWNSITLLAGREGLGKSTLACKLAADATTGALTGAPINVAYLNSEDSRSMTVKPRLDVAGADLDRVYFIDVTIGDQASSTLRLPGDTQALAKALHDADVKLVILDAAKSSMSSQLDGYRDDDVRQFLEPLAKMCDDYGMSVIGLVHFGKRESDDPGKLIMGSIAWSQIARSVLSVAQDDDGQLIVTNTKGNLAAQRVSRAATIQSRPYVADDGGKSEIGCLVWGDYVDVSAADLLVNTMDKDERSEAEEWLTDYLSGAGPTPRIDVLNDARKEHIASEATIKRAFKKIGGISNRQGFPPKATWSLPPTSIGSFGSQTDPRACESDPIEPIGVNQGKHRDPIVRLDHLDHAHVREPNGDPNRGKTTSAHVPGDVSNDEPDPARVREVVLDTLSDDVALSLASLMRTVKQIVGNGSTVPDILDELAAEGVIEKVTTGKWIKTKHAA